MTGGRHFTWRLLAFAILTLGLLAWTLQALGAFSLTASYRLLATFDDATGLLVGSEVKLAGVTVGRVEAIDLTPEHRAQVTLAIRRGVGLGRDCSASIRARSMLGEKLIALQCPPVANGGGVLGAGDVIESTSIEADLGSLAAEAGEAMRGIRSAVDDFGKIAEAVAGLEGEVDAQQLMADLHAVGELARAGAAFLDEHGEDLTATLRAARRGADALAETAESARPPLARLDELLAEIQAAGTVAATAELVAELRKLADEAGPELIETARALRSSIVGSEEDPGLASTLESTAASAQTFFDDATELTAQLQRASKRLETTMGKLDEALDNVSKLSPREIRKILQEEGVKVILLD